MKNNRICFFSGGIHRSGGTERVLIIIANELVKIGYDVTILSFWNHGQPTFSINPNIKIKYLLNPKTEGKLFRTKIYPIIKLHNFIKRGNYDFFIDVDTILANYTNYAIKKTKSKWISWEHFNYYFMINDKSRIKAKKLVMKNANKLIVLTDEDRNLHLEKMDFPKDKIIRIYNPANKIIENNYKFDNKIFFSAGNLIKIKGYDLLLEAWKKFEQTNKEWQLIIAGEGNIKEELNKYIYDNNLKNVRLIGRVNNIEEYYIKSSCYILSSRSEGYPMVIIEASSFGLPIISFDCHTGPKEMVKENGYLVEQNNIESLYNTMIRFTKNIKNAKRMSEKSIEFAKNIRIEKIILEWDNLFKKEFTT